LKNPVIVITFLLSFSAVAFSQCFTKNIAFQSGERLTYDVVYNWGFIWISAGYVEFSVKQVDFQGRAAYFLDANGSSYSSYDWFYKVRDSFQACIDVESLKPLWHKRSTSEGGYLAYEEYNFDYEKKLIYARTQTSKRSYKEDTLRAGYCTFDLLSMAYYARNIDFSGLVPGNLIPVIVVLDNEIHHLYVRFLGRELLTTKDGNRYNTIRFAIKLIEGTVFKSGEDLNVWVTDDKNRVPVLVEAKILVGSVKALLKSADNLRNKSTARIK